MTLALCPTSLELKPFLPHRSYFCHSPIVDFSSHKYDVGSPLLVINLKDFQTF